VNVFVDIGGVRAAEALVRLLPCVAKSVAPRRIVVKCEALAARAEKAAAAAAAKIVVSASASASTDVTTGLKVTTFNVLAPCYRRVKDPAGEVAMESTFPERALERQTRVVDMLAGLASSVVCLQVREFEDKKERELKNMPTHASGKDCGRSLIRFPPPTFPPAPYKLHRSSGTRRPRSAGCTSRA
jgi:hypothetical protein